MHLPPHLGFHQLPPDERTYLLPSPPPGTSGFVSRLGIILLILGFPVTVDWTDRKKHGSLM
ncbi:hypothetical protein Hanom_Chr06g00530861 [Helianthus anomalus]